MWASGFVSRQGFESVPLVEASALELALALHVSTSVPVEPGFQPEWAP